MCGIAGIHFKNPRDMGVSRNTLDKLVDELLIGIEVRGRDATGLLTVDSGGKANLVKADVDATTFNKWRDPMPRRVRTVLGHTRFATQGTPQNLDNNHPVVSGTCFAIHNGHISNDDELFIDHSLERQAEVDSEIIPALLDLYGLDNAEKALEELDGNYAVAAVDPERFPNMTVLAKGWSSPVIVYENKYAVMWASLASTIQDACERVLGSKPDSSKLVELKLGDLWVMEGETVERKSFHPLSKRPKTFTYSTGWSAPATCDTNTVSTDSSVWTKCKSCGHTRLYHGSGSDFAGSCKDIQQGSNFHCRCIAFVEPVKALEPADADYKVEWCDGCGRKFYMDGLTRIGNTYLCKAWCANDPAVVEAGPTATDLRTRAEDVIARQVAAAMEFNVSEVDEVAWNEREAAINEHCLSIAAEKTGMASNFIDWLVNFSGPEIVETDPTGYLGEVKRQAGKAYWDAWFKLDSELEEIDTARFELGDVTTGNDSDTESGELAQVIAIREEVLV